MSLRAIVMADGKAERWGNYTGRPKHLLSFAGETLLQRTVRLLRSNGVRDIIISSRNAAYAVEGANLWAPPDNEIETDKFFATRAKWNDGGETILVYGDCFFTPAAMRTICGTSSLEEPSEFLFFGRAKGSTRTEKKSGELFAVRLGKHDAFLAGCTFIRDGLAAGSIWRGGGWELYRHLTGREANSDHFITTHFREINDYTDDFDFPEDFDNFVRAWGRSPDRVLAWGGTLLRRAAALVR